MDKLNHRQMFELLLSGKTLTDSKLRKMYIVEDNVVILDPKYNSVSKSSKNLSDWSLLEE